jgi:hypothetical protein
VELSQKISLTHSVAQYADHVLCVPKKTRQTTETLEQATTNSHTRQHPTTYTSGDGTRQAQARQQAAMEG